MTEPAHHLPEAMLAALAAGTLPYPFALLAAAHVSLCGECRARLHAHQVAGGVVLDALAPAELSQDVRGRTLAAVRTSDPVPAEATGDGPYPAPIAGLIGATGPRWRSLGLGAKQSILWSGAEGWVRLLWIPAGQAVPEHGHRGLELTLVLSGAFADAFGVFQAGDIEVADEDVGHIPKATDEGPCLCVAATDAPIRFRSLMPRLLQPIFRI